MSDAPDSTFIPPTIDELAGLLPNYTFTRMIASGGMGAVYEATQTALDRRVAIKVLPRELYQDEDFRASFAQEAKAMAKLNHPNLIGVYDFGEVDELQYIVMEFVAGEALHYSIYQQQVDPAEAIRIVQETCAGLDSAHNAGLLHRDIKPANILLDEELHAKIGDFGLARPAENDEEGVIFGTPGYVAPEVLEAPDQMCPATDVYAVGAMLYELLTGETPPHGTPPPSAAAVCGCDRRLDIIIAKATHPDLSQRYSSAAELSAALNNIKNSLIRSRSLAVAPAASASGRAPRVARPAVGGAATESSSEAEKSASNAVMRNLIIIAVLLAAIVGVVSMIQKRDADNLKKDQLAQAEAEEAAANAEALKPPPSVETPPENVPLTEPEVVEPEPLTGTTLEQLAEVKNELVGGSRERFPTAAVRAGENVYLFVPRELTWYEAQDFAAGHGAQLAVLATNRSLQLASRSIESGSAWIGAGEDGNERWRWTDGQEWSVAGMNPTAGSFATIDKTGFLNATPAAELHPFLMQWKMDGSTPGGLSEQLDSVNSGSIATSTYPVGTMKFRRHRFYYLQGEMTWAQARERARELGGHLAAPASADELEFLRETLLNTIKPNAVVWLGLSATQGDWKWVDGTAAEGLDWVAAPETDERFGALAFTDVLGLKALEGTELADGCIIEWDEESSDLGEPVAVNEVIVEDPADPAAVQKLSDLQEIRKKAAQRATITLTNELRDLTEGMTKNFDRSVGRLSANQQATARKQMIPFMKSLEKVGLVGDIPRRAIARLSADLRDHYDYARKKALEVQIGADRAMRKLDAAYLRQLESLQAEYSDDAAFQRMLRKEMKLTQKRIDDLDVKIATSPAS